MSKEYLEHIYTAIAFYLASVWDDGIAQHHYPIFCADPSLTNVMEYLIIGAARRSGKSNWFSPSEYRSRRVLQFFSRWAGKRGADRCVFKTLRRARCG
jgi:hypothetical protein